MKEIMDTASVLIVDDSNLNLLILAEILSEININIQTAKSGEEALSIINNSKPDLLLLDIVMPGLSGWEVCSILKSKPETKNIPIIVLSTLNKTEDKVKAFSLGAIDYITKPFENNEVLSRVKIHLEISILQKSLQQKIDEYEVLNEEYHAQNEEYLSLNEELRALNEELSEKNILVEKSNNKLLLSEQKFKNLVETTNDIIWETNMDGVFTYINPNIEVVLGYKQEEAIGHSPFEFMPQDEAKSTIEKSNEIVNSKKAYAGLVNINKHKNGHAIILETSGTPIFDSNNNLIGYRGISRDITDRIDIEKKLNDSKILFDIASKSAVIGGWMYNIGSPNVFWSDVVCQIHEMPKGHSPKVEDAINYYAPEFRDIISEALNKCLNFGIPFDEKLQIITSKGNRVWVRAKGEAGRDKIGRIISAFGSFQDISEVIKAREKIHKSNERSKVLIETSPDLIFVQDRDGVYLDFHAPDESLLYLKPQYFVGKNIKEVLPIDLAERLLNVFKKAIETNELQYLEYELLTPNSDEVTIYEARIKSFDNDKVMSIVRNITEQKKYEQRIKESEAKYRSLFENMNVGIGAVDENENFIFTNPEIEKIFGVKPGKLLGMNLSNFINKKDMHIIYAQTLIRKQKQSSEYEIKIKQPSGNERIILISAVPEFNSCNEFIGTQAIVQDITAQREYEIALKESEERYRFLFNNSGSIFCIVNADKTIELVSPEFEKHLGYQKEEIEGKRKFIEFVHPEDVQTMINNHIQRRIKPESVPKNHKFRIITAKKEIKTMYMNVDLLPGTDKSIASLIDISELENANKKIIENEQKYRLISEKITDVIWLMDLNGNSTYVSPSIKNFTGFSVDEYLQQSIKNRFTIESSKKAIHIFQKELTKYKNNLVELENYFLKIELEYICKNGETKWGELIITPYLNNQKELAGIHGVTRDITERKKTEIELIESKNFLSDVIEKNGALIYVKDLNGRYELVNKKWEEITNIKNADTIGKTDFDLFNFKVAENFRKLDLKVIEEGKEIQSEEILDDDLGRRYFISIKFPLKNSSGKITGICGISTEITDRKNDEILLKEKNEFIEAQNEEYRQINEELFEAKEKAEKNQLKVLEQARLLELVFKHSIESIVLLDKDYNFIKVSETYAKSCQKNVSDFIGKNHFELFPSILKDEFDEKKKNKEVYYKQARPFLFPDNPEWGITYWDLGLVPILDKNKNIEMYIFTLKNVTEEIINKKELILAKQKAEESDKLKSSFLANLSHEIRTPMNSIVGFSDLLRKKIAPNEQTDKFIELIQSNSKQLASIIDDIVNLSKMEVNQLFLNNEEFEINKLLINVFNTFEIINKDNRKVKLFFENNNSNDNLKITSDQVKLTQILSNLIKNALKFTSQGSVTFGYKILETQNTKPSQKKFLQFYVKDTGIGISEEKQEIIFERFRQADESIAKQFGGNGLGLAISKGFVEKMGGKIWVESELGKGSTFYFTIPTS